MPQPFDQLPSSLRAAARTTTLAGVPTLLAHPDWDRPAPCCLWLHGRTAYKELDPGRYLRWIRAGIGAIAIDLPGHGERGKPGLDGAEHTLEVMRRALAEIDPLLDAVESAHPGMFDRERMAIGGMSLGGMIALRRLCEPHGFMASAVESTTGWLGQLYHPDRALDPEAEAWTARHEPDAIEPLDPIKHLAGFCPLPLLALHSESDRMVRLAGMRAFLDRLRDRYTEAGSDPNLIELHTWPETGAPQEHIGFGKVAAEAKDRQTAFLTRHLRPQRH
ncbi:MAG: hypothetical protein EA378_12150 [Phycisphaerales bacterium]|nr:MAG: hypothetical protein EA378_12150 [Phycisphaerales bacterium]